jgi:ubiquinone/menaquinone biosynthesis C-methylase UbiE
MLPNDTDKHWEYWGRTNPYWAVFVLDKYLKENIDEEAVRQFFQSGQAHIDSILRTIHTYLDPRFQPINALDFGCGVGRLVIPLSALCGSVVGVDVSASMLQEAKRNCKERHISNVEFLIGDDDLSQLSGSFDFIHSFIVFQHIPPKRGEKLFRRLISLLHENGIGVLHFTYSQKVSFAIRLRIWAYKSIPFLFGIRNLIKGKPFGEAMMQMNQYQLSNLFQILQENGCGHCYVRFTEHGADRGVILFFQKAQKEYADQPVN